MLFDDAYRFVSRRESTSRTSHIEDLELAEQNLLLLERDHCLHGHALPALQLAARAGCASFSSTSLHTLVAMVAEGMGSTLLPDLAINGGILEGSDFVVRPLRESASARTIGLCWRKTSSRNEDFLQFGEFIRHWASHKLEPWPSRPRSGNIENVSSQSG